MRRALFITLLALTIARASIAEEANVPRLSEARASATAAGPSRDSYRIGAGDVLQISVWKEPDLSVPSVQVRPDGKISIPMLGDVQAAGLTPSELQESVKTGFSKLIAGVDVFLLVREVHSERAFVIGAVRKEGAIILSSPMTVLQLLAEAGGLTEYAKPGKIQVLRSQAGKQIMLQFDYNAVIRGKNPQQNVIVLPGDTVVIPR